MADSKLETTAEAQIRFDLFEARTGLPARATLEELEMSGGRYFGSGSKTSDGKPKVEYMVVDFSGSEQNIVFYKREAGQEEFVVHLEASLLAKY